MTSLAGKVALIMGGGADGPPAQGEEIPIGMGRAAAIACARAGASVVVADRDLKTAQITADFIVKEGHVARAVACDVSNPDQCRAAVEDAVSAYGALHLLVNNVAIADTLPPADASVDEFERILSVNVRGQFLAIKYALPAMEKAGGGSIVNVSSLNGVRSGGGAGVAYETSKAALLGLTRNIAVNAAAIKVRANTVLPGIINSTMLRRHVGDLDIDFSHIIPMARMGTPWEVAKAIVFLLSDDASYISGTHLLVDGGAAAAL